MKRKEFMLDGINLSEKGLEIGPSFSPLCPKKEGYRIKIIDHMNREMLIEKYKDNINVNKFLSNIEEVDYVWNGEPYEELVGANNKFSYIIASHVIEHSVDLLNFLNGCTNILIDGGVISLAIPDKRFTFDCFREITSIREVINNNLVNCDKKHSLGTYIDNVLNTTVDQDGGTYVAYGSINRTDRLHVIDKIDKFQVYENKYNNSTHLDVHGWIFTPNSFSLLIYELNLLNLINLKIKKMYKVPNSIEFLVQLEKGKEEYNPTEFMSMHSKKNEDLLEEYKFIEKMKMWLNKKIYLFGYGTKTNRCRSIIETFGKKIDGIIVSDNFADQMRSEKDIMTLSQITLSEEVLIVICVGADAREEVEQLLKKNNFYNFI